MVLTGRIRKSTRFWLAECDLVDVWTQGRTLHEAREMLVDAIQTRINRDSVSAVSITVERGKQLGANDYAVHVSASEPSRLLAEVLSCQRERNRLSLADVTKRLGSATGTRYARYERGGSTPSIDRLISILRVVAPGVDVTLASRATSTRVRSRVRNAATPKRAHTSKRAHVS
jgi:hypothetical protein